MRVWWCAVHKENERYEVLKERQVVAQGWHALGDLSDLLPLVPDQEEAFIEAIQRRGDSLYGSEQHWSNHRARTGAPTGLFNLLSIRAGDLVVAIEGTTVRGICQMGSDAKSSYAYDATREYAQTVGHPVAWVDWNDATFGPPPKATRMLAVRSLNEDRALVEMAWARRHERNLGSTHRERCLFVRVGWMDYYGHLPEESGPIGGGSHNKTSVGAEASNFVTRDGQRLRGYAHPSSGIDLTKLDPAAGDEHIDDVLVVMFATRPKRGGQVIVGWYRGARCFATVQEADGETYYFEVDRAHSVLLPPADRSWHVPTGKDKPGTSDIFYAGIRRGPQDAWIDDILQKIETFAGENLLDRSDLTDADAADVVDAAEHGGGGRGIRLPAAVRREIELRAVDEAIKHYSKNWKVEVRGKPYDLRCTRQDAELHVEVKGTTTPGEDVLLTANEVAHARAAYPDVALFVLCDIDLSYGPAGEPIATGGRIVLHEPWEIDAHRLEAVAYRCSVNPNGGAKD
jgi:hypothetical protein